MKRNRNNHKWKKAVCIAAAFLMLTGQTVAADVKETAPAGEVSADETEIPDDMKTPPGEDDTQTPPGEDDTQTPSEENEPQDPSGEEVLEADTPELYEAAALIAAEMNEELSYYRAKGSFFDDVAEDCWFAPAAGFHLSKGLIVGTGNNIFAGYDVFCRAQIVTVLHRMSGSPAKEYISRFPDVKEGNFYTTAVMWASSPEVGVIKGYENGLFGPVDGLTREQLATMLYRYAACLGKDTSSEISLVRFPDRNKVTEFAEDAMKWAVQNGIIQGTGEGYLNPQGITSRAEGAVMLARFCLRFMEGEFEDVDFSVKCSGIYVSNPDTTEGYFCIGAADVACDYPIKDVAVLVTAAADPYRPRWVYLNKTGEGFYSGAFAAADWNYSTGTYTCDAYARLENGLRFHLGEGSGNVSAQLVRNVTLQSYMPFAGYSKINSGWAVYYRASGWNRKNFCVCVNAGHGTSGGGSVKTLSHPDGSPKVTGGTTAAGEIYSTAVSSGMTFLDGTAERAVTLEAAILLRDKLRNAGYDVLMIREGSDVQLDNIARTVLANNYANCHVALHWDSTTSDKGCFYMSTPNVASYRSMYPVSATWPQSEYFGHCLLAGLSEKGRALWGNGTLEMDLTQTSYSTIPSVDIELGDKASDHSYSTLNRIADGLVRGIEIYRGL